MTASCPLAALALALTLLSGCRPDVQEMSPSQPLGDTFEGTASQDTDGSTEAFATHSPEASSRVPAPADLDAVDLTLQPLVQLDAPTAMADRSGDSALYVAERAGRVVRVVGGSVDTPPVLDISDQTTSDGERGLLGVDFSHDGSLLYVSYTDQNGDSRVAEYRMDGNRADAGTRRSILEVGQPYSNHNGGNVVVGPDSLLYVGLGDGGSANDPHGNGQNRSTLLGSLLRIDPSAQNRDPYGIPGDNPFVDANDARPEIWAYGLRNPWRFSFDRRNDDLWIADVGQGNIEEIDWLPFDQVAGTNFGWNAFEGSRPFAGGQAEEAVAPVFEYPHDDGRCSVTGGYVYRGSEIAHLSGAYLYGDYCDGVIRALVLDDGEVTQERTFDLQVSNLVSFGQDARGELYALSLAGPIFRLSAAS